MDRQTIDRRIELKRLIRTAEHARNAVPTLANKPWAKRWRTSHQSGHVSASRRMKKELATLPEAPPWWKPVTGRAPALPAFNRREQITFDGDFTPIGAMRLWYFEQCERAAESRFADALRFQPVDLEREAEQAFAAVLASQPDDLPVTGAIPSDVKRFDIQPIPQSLATPAERTELENLLNETLRPLLPRYGHALALMLDRSIGDPVVHVAARNLIAASLKYHADNPRPIPALSGMSAKSPYRRSTWAASLLTELFYRIGWTNGQASRRYLPDAGDVSQLKRTLIAAAMADLTPTPLPAAVAA